MRPVLPKLDQTSCLVSILSEMEDTSLVHADLGNFLERTKNPQAGSLMEKIVKSGLVEAVAFPLAAPCPDLVLDCMNIYESENRCIRTSDGEMLVHINRETVMATMGIPHKEEYEDWTIGNSYTYFSEKNRKYRSVITRNWLLRVQKGGSRLPKPLTREHLIIEVWDIVVLLNRVKVNSHSFY